MDYTSDETLLLYKPNNKKSCDAAGPSIVSETGFTVQSERMFV